MSLALSFSKAKKLPESPTSMVSRPSEKYVSEVGDEAETIKDVNIREGHGARSKKVGLAESGSRVRVIEKFEKWRRIGVLSHGRQKKDPDSLARAGLTEAISKPSMARPIGTPAKTDAF